MSNDKDLGEAAGASFEAGLYCAESVVKNVAERYGVDSPLVPRIATGFCSGLSRTCGPCGALSGGVLALNLVLGRDHPEQSVEENYAAVQRLVDRFQSRFGATECEKLLDCDLGTAEGQEKFEREGLGKRCTRFTAEAAHIVGEILDTRDP